MAEATAAGFKENRERFEQQDKRFEQLEQKFDSRIDHLELLIRQSLPNN